MSNAIDLLETPLGRLLLAAEDGPLCWDDNFALPALVAANVLGLLQPEFKPAEGYWQWRLAPGGAAWLEAARDAARLDALERANREALLQPLFSLYRHIPDLGARTGRAINTFRNLADALLAAQEGEANAAIERKTADGRK